MIPLGIDLASGLSRFVTFFNWTRVMIITQNIPAFVEVDKNNKQIVTFVVNYHYNDCMLTLDFTVAPRDCCFPYRSQDFIY